MDTRTALLTVLDQVDYTNKACAPTEMVGAVLPKEVIKLARDAAQKPDPTVEYVTDLEIALKESVRLQSHMAKLLNQYDGGERMSFASPDAWIERLREIGALPKR